MEKKGGVAVPEPTATELSILQALWKKGPLSVRDVWTELGKKTGYTTILKFLQIMLGKGLVRRDESRMTHVYEAALPAVETQERLVSRFIERAFGGSAGQLVLRALAARPVSADERRAIRSLLAEKERRGP